MKLTVPHDELASVAGWVTTMARLSKLPPGAPPVMAGMLLTADGDGTATAAGFDGDASATANVAGAAVGEPGKILIPARLLAEIARVLPAGPVEITSDGTRATLTARRTTYHLMLLPTDYYPDLPADGELAAEFDASTLAAAVGQVAGSAGTDETLRSLTCVQVVIGDSTATLAATDRYRLAFATVPCTGGGADGTPLLIPAAHLAAIAKQARGGPAVRVTAGPGGRGITAFAAAGRRVTTRLYEDEFPALARLMPPASEHAAVLTVGISEFTAAINRAALVAARNTPVRFAFGDGEVLMESGTGDEAACAEPVTAVIDGKPPESIAFNPAMLASTLATVAASGADTARIALISDRRPAVITAANPAGDWPVAATHALMPIRLAG
jgi:DNA polymerase III subunit beta